MERKLFAIGIVLVLGAALSSCDNVDECAAEKSCQKVRKVYQVHRLSGSMRIDGDFDKPVWRKVEPLYIDVVKGAEPKFKPKAQVKLLYDDDYIYVCFHVQDRDIRAITTENYGRVWEDACVEFFFTPGEEISKSYFNFEANCIGTVIFRHQTGQKENVRLIEPSDLERVEIAHSLPKGAIDPERGGPISWTMEYRLPLDILEKYRGIIRPAAGVEWRANFYKCAGNSSNPHSITWSRIEEERATFHRPEYFGVLEFVD